MKYNIYLASILYAYLVCVYIYNTHIYIYLAYVNKLDNMLVYELTS
jgi:hypothetical protein